jgi:hypothetical protein
MGGKPRNQEHPSARQARLEFIEQRKARQAQQKQEAAEALARRRSVFAVGDGPDLLEIFREGLALARRAGMPWEQAQYAALAAALSVLPRPEDIDERLTPKRIARCRGSERVKREEERKRIEEERSEWAVALYDTRTTWMRSYERRPTDCAL